MSDGYDATNKIIIGNAFETSISLYELPMKLPT